MFKDEILENENRRRIYWHIELYPGIHLRELQRDLNMPLTTLEYHLGYMKRRGVVLGETEGHFKRYYTRQLDKDDKKVLSSLRQKRLRDIVLLVMANRKAKYRYLSDYLKLPNSTLSFYLKYLVEKGILLREKIGYETIYTVNDENRIARVVIAYRTSFLDKLVDKALAT
jgi:predicted transcriptional regulator